MKDRHTRQRGRDREADIKADIERQTDPQVVYVGGVGAQNLWVMTRMMDSNG